MFVESPETEPNCLVGEGEDLNAWKASSEIRERLTDGCRGQFPDAFDVV